MSKIMKVSVYKADDDKKYTVDYNDEPRKAWRFADQNICSAKDAAKVNGEGYIPIKIKDEGFQMYANTVDIRVIQVLFLSGGIYVERKESTKS